MALAFSGAGDPISRFMSHFITQGLTNNSYTGIKFTEPQPFHWISQVNANGFYTPPPTDGYEVYFGWLSFGVGNEVNLLVNGNVLFIPNGNGTADTGNGSVGQFVFFDHLIDEDTDIPSGFIGQPCQFVGWRMRAISGGPFSSIPVLPPPVSIGYTISEITPDSISDGSGNFVSDNSAHDTLYFVTHLNGMGVGSYALVLSDSLGHHTDLILVSQGNSNNWDLWSFASSELTNYDTVKFVAWANAGNTGASTTIFSGLYSDYFGGTFLINGGAKTFTGGSLQITDFEPWRGATGGEDAPSVDYFLEPYGIMQSSANPALNGSNQALTSSSSIGNPYGLNVGAGASFFSEPTSPEAGTWGSIWLDPAFEDAFSSQDTSLSALTGGNCFNYMIAEM